MNPQTGMSIEEATHGLRSLHRSLQEAERRNQKPSPAELREFKTILVMLQIAGHDVSAATWDEDEPDMARYPWAYQVLPQVEQLMAQIGVDPHAPDFRSRPIDVDPYYAFIIMAMLDDDPQLVDVHEAITGVCSAAGLKAQRVDEIEHSGRITDKIIECITKASVVIADLTHNRPNCFYEAGVAHGMNKNVIFTARQGTELHFDIKDYSVIFYSNMVELRTGLQRRISETHSKAE